MKWEELTVGARAYVISRDTNGTTKKVLGTIGRLLGTTPMQWIVKMDDGHVGLITEANIVRIFPEPSN
jgi:hypothetical protein